MEPARSPRLGSTKAGGASASSRGAKRVGRTASRRSAPTDRRTRMGRAPCGRARLGCAEDRGARGSRRAFMVRARGAAGRAFSRTSAMECAGPGSTSRAIILVCASGGGSGASFWRQRHR
jgi:hypothetical protein